MDVEQERRERRRRFYMIERAAFSDKIIDGYVVVTAHHPAGFEGTGRVLHRSPLQGTIEATDLALQNLFRKVQW